MAPIALFHVPTRVQHPVESGPVQQAQDSSCLLRLLLGFGKLQIYSRPNIGIGIFLSAPYITGGQLLVYIVV